MVVGPPGFAMLHPGLDAVVLRRRALLPVATVLAKRPEHLLCSIVMRVGQSPYKVTVENCSLTDAPMRFYQTNPFVDNSAVRENTSKCGTPRVARSDFGLRVSFDIRHSDFVIDRSWDLLIGHSPRARRRILAQFTQTGLEMASSLLSWMTRT